MTRHSRSRQKSTPVAAALPDLPRIQPKMSMLGRDDCLRLHQASLEVLHKTGVEVYNPTGLELLKKAGTAVTGNLVKIPPTLVEWALAQPPRVVRLGARDPSRDVVLNGRRPHHTTDSQGTEAIDLETGERHGSTAEDLRRGLLFADALDHFSRQIWRGARKRKRYRYDMAILVDPGEKLPPSDRGALKSFMRAGRELGIDAELITKRDYPRLPEFDALFIRETTGIDHHTYRFARKAEAEGMVVVDDPVSILRCTNKVYLADLFRTRKVPAPRSLLLHRDEAGLAERLEAELGYPMVIKIPDGSFSRGIVKVHDRKELQSSLKQLFRKSALLLAQEFFYTDFDWRIGILNNRPLYACRYYMVKNHWQIYRHGGQRVASGDFDTLPTFEVPREVLQSAQAATRPIGCGLYGVDVKERDGMGYVVEVNDNPNMDRGIEDRYLGDELYRLVMAEFLRRIEAVKAALKDNKVQMTGSGRSRFCSPRGKSTSMRPPGCCWRTRPGNGSARTPTCCIATRAAASMSTLSPARLRYPAAVSCTTRPATRAAACTLIRM